MRAYAQKPKTAQPTPSFKSTTRSRDHFGQGRDPNSILNLQRTAGNQAVQRLLGQTRGGIKGESAASETTPLGHGSTRTPNYPGSTSATQAKPAVDKPGNESAWVPRSDAARSVTRCSCGDDLSRVPAQHAGDTERPATTVGATPTRDAGGGGSGEEVSTFNGILGPVAAAPTGQCYVDTGPTYTPTGSIPVTTSGGRKRATFTFAATFGAALVTVPPRKPSCCEVRQYIKWDNAFHTWRGGPPHSGFPSSATANTWYEDRDSSDKRYGHRSGTHSDPIAGCGDEYKTGGSRDQANGDTYCGRDSPGGPSSLTGKWSFQLKVIDTCDGNAVKASSSVITVNW